MLSTQDTAPIRVRSRANLYDAIRRVGTMDARRIALRLKLAKQIETAKARYADELAELDDAIADQAEKLAAYVAGHQDSVLGGAKTVMTEAGEIAIRALPVQVEVTDQDAAVAHLENSGQDAYIRRSVTLDKRALVKDKPAVEGLGYVEGRQQVVVTPITSGEKIAVQL